MPFPPYSLLDFEQAIQGAYDEGQRRLRVDSSAVVVGGSLDVDTTHTEDSIRLGDGTNYLTSTTIGPKVALDVNILNAELEIIETEPNEAKIFNISVPLAGVETTQTLPTGTNKFIMRNRGSKAVMKLAFSPGASSTNYIEIARGAVYESEEIDGGGIILYFQTTQPSTVVEILAWRRV